ASRAGTPILPAMPATRRADWCSPARRAAGWPRSTAAGCLRPSTSRPDRRASPPAPLWSRCGDCAPIAPIRGRSWCMASPDVQGIPSRQASSGREVARVHEDSDHDHLRVHGAPLAHDADALISARSLWLSRSGRAVLQGVDIDIAAGEILTVIGPNGAGKTTLVRVLLGLERADKGSSLRKAGLVIGYVPQRFEVDRAIPLTVARFVDLGRRSEEEEIDKVLAEVGAS